ncbi:hypothetical protein V1292_005864 [Bradyrhizobium sp. AZCC 1719]
MFRRCTLDCNATALLSTYLALGSDVATLCKGRVGSDQLLIVMSLT